MVESRCGILCSKCEYKEKMNCQGCLAIDKPFWGDSCPVKSCCEARMHHHCGECPDFPCDVLTEMAYAEEEGDNGKRIENCRKWANKNIDGKPFIAVGQLSREAAAFDAEEFVADVVTQNATSLQTHFAPDAIIRWHETNEELTLPEYIRANCEYPGEWRGKLERVVESNNEMSLVYRIESEGVEFLVAAFAKLANGKITQLDEYFCTCGTAPQWRLDMKIGRPIVEGKTNETVGW